jgi:OOP family OmpA-OmpF porin
MNKKRPCWLGFWASLAVAGLITLLTMFVFPDVSLRALEARLGEAVNASLAQADLSGLDVEMRGQKAFISGAVGDEADKARIIKLALKADGAGGQFWGGVTNVDVSGLRVENADALPYSWGARKSASGVVLTGSAPDEATRAALLKAAEEYFGGAPQDMMQVKAGAPGGDWALVARGALQQLAKLKRGRVRLNGTVLIVQGETDQATKTIVEQHYAQPLPAPYTVLGPLDLLVDGQPLPVKGLERFNLAEASGETCQAAFAELMRTRAIEFASNSAVINPVSDAFLQDIGKVARRCDQYRVLIVGHTDDEGDAVYNKDLSERRAKAVRLRLVDLGMGAERIETSGMGEERPLVPATTPEARQRNRRIEFTVTN